MSKRKAIPPDTELKILLESTRRCALCYGFDRDLSRKKGVRILTATDGESAVPLARQEHPTLILLDMDLPGIDGLAVCRMLRAESDQHLRDIPILMLSGIMLEEADLVEAFSAGATDYLTKPFKPTLLRSRVHAWLSRTVTT